MPVYIVMKKLLLGCDVRLVTLEKHRAKEYVRYSDERDTLFIVEKNINGKEIYRLFA